MVKKGDTAWHFIRSNHEVDGLSCDFSDDSVSLPPDRGARLPPRSNRKRSTGSRIGGLIRQVTRRRQHAGRRNGWCSRSRSAVPAILRRRFPFRPPRARYSAIFRSPRHSAGRRRRRSPREAIDLVHDRSDGADIVDRLLRRRLHLGDLRRKYPRSPSRSGCASALTSDATTANPRPASPARAASIVALSASRLV